MRTRRRAWWWRLHFGAALDTYSYTVYPHIRSRFLLRLQWLAPYCTCTSDISALEATVEHGDSAPIPRSFPSPSSYVTRGMGALGVVDRTLIAFPATCSSRHLTSHLSHSYISIHSLHSHWPFPFWCVLSQSRLRAWGSKTTREWTSWVAIRVG